MQEKAAVEVRDCRVDLVMGVSEGVVKDVNHFAMEVDLIRCDGQV